MRSNRFQAFRVFCSCFVFFLSSQTIESSAQETVPQTRVKVIDRQGNPIRGAVVYKHYIWQPDGVERRALDRQEFEVDENGIATWELPGGPNYLHVSVRADKFVPVSAAWTLQDLTKEKPPAELTFQLVPGIELGGIVSDEDGKPIPGVKVDVRCLTDIKFEGRIRMSSDLVGGDDAAVTDELGRWSINNAPDNADAEFVVGMRHPDFLEVPVFYRDPKKQKIADLKSLRNKTAAFNLVRGITVKGIVVDKQGNPVEWGSVVIGKDRTGRIEGFEIGADGRFELPPRLAGQIRLTTVVRNFAPQSRLVDVIPTMGELKIELESGYETKIQVVDSFGAPISMAVVSISRWQDSESLYNFVRPGRPDLGIPMVTDGDGLFHWTWAPKDKVRFAVSKRGYQFVDGIELEPSDEPFVVQLQPTLMVTGTVSDSSNAQKLARFSVIPVDYRKSRNRELVRERPSRLLPGRNGRFRIQFSPRTGDSDLDKEYGFKIEAVNYKPWFSERFRMGQMVGPQIIELEPQTWPAVRILNVDGQPAADVPIRIASRTKYLSVGGYQFRSRPGEVIANTDENGEAQIPLFDEPFKILAYDEHGYAEADFASTSQLGEIRLKKWASLKGRVSGVNEQPIADMRLIFNGIRVGHNGSKSIQDNYGATTDADGRFEFPRLPPIRGLVRTLWVDGEKTDVNRISIPVMLEPGKSTEVEIGKGITVRGKIRLDAEPEVEVDLSNANVSIRPIAPPTFGWPEGVAELNEYDWRGGATAFKQLFSRGSKIYYGVYLNSTPSYSAIPQTDGPFAIKVNGTGDYEASIRVSAFHSDEPGTMFAAAAGYRLLRFKVNEAHEQAGVLDLGTIDVPAYQAPKLGTMLDDFEFSVDGDQMSLVDFRGGYVLLDFWSPRCEACQADQPRITEFVDNQKLSGVIVLSLTSDKDGKFQRTNGANEHWKIAQLLESNVHPRLTEKLGIWSFPRYLILNPEGRLIYHGALKGAIEELGKAQK